MPETQTERIQEEFLSWINDELQKEVHRQEEIEEESPTLVGRMKTLLAAGMSAVSLLVLIGSGI